MRACAPRESGFPVLFAYRHALELYLKIVGDIREPIHRPEKCIHSVQNRHAHKIPSPGRGWIIELDNLDPHGRRFPLCRS